MCAVELLVFKEFGEAPSTVTVHVFVWIPTMAADSKYSCAGQHMLWIAVILPPVLVIIFPFQSQVMIFFCCPCFEAL